MDDIPMKTNHLVRSVIHQPFQQAVSQLGLPDFPRPMFTQDIGDHLHASGSLFDDEPKTIRKLWKAVLRGDVLLTELDGEQLFFYVRAHVGPRVMDIRLACQNHDWRVDSVVSMHRRPVMKSSGFTGSTLVLAILVAGAVGYEVHGPLSQKLAPLLRHQATSSSSQSGGNLSSASGTANKANLSTSGTASNATQSQTASASPQGNPTSGISITSSKSQGGTSNSSATSSASNTTTTSKANSTAGQSAQTAVTFTLKSGMPLHDLSSFLAQKGIIVESAATFDHDLTVAGIDRTIRPGKYTFHSGMTKQQIFSVLKHGK